MNSNLKVSSLPARSFWIVIALFCIVFSSASKKLIEQKLAPYFTVSQVIGKQIKNGSREKRDLYNCTVQTEHSSPVKSTPELLFFLPAFISFVLTVLLARFYRNKNGTVHPFYPVSALPLYLNIHKLQV